MLPALRGETSYELRWDDDALMWSVIPRNGFPLTFENLPRAASVEAFHHIDTLTLWFVRFSAEKSSRV